MSLSQFHCTSRLYLDMHGLIFETSICYWQDQPGRPPCPGEARRAPPPRRGAPPRAFCWAAVRRRSPPRGRALRRSPCSPFRVPGRKVCYRGWVCSATFRSYSVVSPEGWPEPRHWQRSRKRVSGARLRGASAHSSSPPASWEGGRPTAPLGRSVVGQLGQTGRLGLARPGSATEVREGAPESLRAWVLRGLVGPAVRQAASARYTLGAGGALARGGLRVPFDQWGWAGATFRSVFGAPGGGAGGRQTVRSDPRGAVPGLRSPARSPARAGSHIRAGKSWKIVRESFSKKGGGRGARGGPWLLDHLQAPRGAAPTPACPTEGHSPSHTRDGTGAPRILDLFPLPEGKGGRATCLRELRGARPARAARDGAPPSGCGAPRSAPARAGSLQSGWDESENRSGEFFKERRGERSQGKPLAPRPPPGSEGGSAAAGLPHRGHLSFPYARWHWCLSISGSFSPLRGRGEDSHGLRELRGRSPPRTGPRRCTSVGRRSSAFLPGTPWDLGVPPPGTRADAPHPVPGSGHLFRGTGRPAPPYIPP